MKKKLSLLLALCMALSILVYPVSAANISGCGSWNTPAAETEIMPLDLELMDGTITNATQWSEDIKLSKSNGKYVNFFIINTGSVDIMITINDTNARTLSPGESGHIYTEVTGPFSKTYSFKAVPATSGKISFQYYIAQRDNQ